MFFANVADTKVVNHQREKDGAIFVAPEAGGVFDGVVTKMSKAFDELEVGNDAGLWKAVHAMPDLHVDKAFMDKVKKFVLLNDLVQNHGNVEPHVFIPVPGCSEIVIFKSMSKWRPLRVETV